MLKSTLSRTCSLSSTSSFSSFSDANAEVGGNIQNARSKSPALKCTRKRFSHDQLMVLEQAFHNSSHPTREDREEIAKKAQMSVKSVTIWFQNKRQAERKVVLGKLASRNAPSPLSMYPVQRTGAQQSPSSSSSPSIGPELYSALVPPKARSHLPVRTASGYLSLDRVASRSERAPRTPINLSRCVSYYEQPSPDALWESMLSSPIQPESNGSPRGGPASSPTAREYLDFTSARRGTCDTLPRGRRTLEWACAAARISVNKEDVGLKSASWSDQTSPTVDLDNDMSCIDDDTGTEIIDTEMESVGDSHEAITPDASQVMYCFGSLPTQALRNPIQKDVKELSEANSFNKNLHPEQDGDIMAAAWALCGLSSLRGQ